MVKLDILSGNLGTDLDTPYCEEGNKIDVYSSVYWTADSKEEYKKKEDIINSYKVENNLFELSAWCDISGYHYWVIQQEEENYVSIDVVLKKQPNEYTESELIIIRDAIIKADEYFDNALN